LIKTNNKPTSTQCTHFLAQGVTYPVNNVYHHDYIAAKIKKYLVSNTWPSAAAHYFRSISTVYLE
jgi:hypothetical protein